MRSTSLLLAILLATAPALSGCLGFGEDEGETVGPTGEDDRNDSTNDTSEGNDTGEPSDEEAETGSNATEGNESGDEDRRWTYDNRTGTVSGTNAVVTSSGSEEERFTVQPDTMELGLELSAEGGELEMCIQQPSENESDDDSESCDETVTTEEGNASFQAAEPSQGEWTVQLRPAEPGQHSIDYELVVAQLVPQRGR